MLKHCEYCGQEFEAKRRTARFCSGSHRSQFAYAARHGVRTPRQRSGFWFRQQYKEQLQILTDYLSAQAADGLSKIAGEYGYEVAEAVLADVVIPCYDAHRDKWVGIDQTAEIAQEYATLKAKYNALLERHETLKGHYDNCQQMEDHWFRLWQECVPE